MPELPLFVFGTLRRGEENHHCLAGTFDRCLPAVLEGFRRAMARHGYPTIVRALGERVEGELFFLSREKYEMALGRCDILEDLAPGELAGPFYRRIVVKVDTSEGAFDAWVYADAKTE